MLTPVSGLSDRQRAALLAAFDLGYYEQPRQATHKDVAARLDCAPNTASEHLQKAEMKVITNVLQFEFER
ncbi:helix-turn-helix domain-containing protein [Halocatena marina]|uniref:Helix-turn-helix domain-containing protein n=1 Tax=Halocatena marina TaxID=2934937 RepID=A0ABD5YIN1_9EURY|nr:helix-turn-helix domain-containing protein [Halocatena marina]